MAAKIKSQTDDTLVIEVTLPLERSMLEGEGRIEQALNEAGTLATGELLQCFDTDGNATCTKAPKEARPSVPWSAMRG